MVLCLLCSFSVLFDDIRCHSNVHITFILLNYRESFPGFYGFDLYRPLCGDTYEASETKPSTAFFVSKLYI